MWRMLCGEERGWVKKGDVEYLWHICVLTFFLVPFKSFSSGFFLPSVFFFLFWYKPGTLVSLDLSAYPWEFVCCGPGCN